MSLRTRHLCNEARFQRPLYGGKDGGIRFFKRRCEFASGNFATGVTDARVIDGSYHFEVRHRNFSAHSSQLKQQI
jgi:hypothetical protein